MTTDLLIAQVTNLFTKALTEKAPAILAALQDSAEGKHGFSSSFKLNYVGSKIFVDGTLSHSTKDAVAFDGCFDVEDSNNPKLPGIDEE